MSRTVRAMRLRAICCLPAVASMLAAALLVHAGQQPVGNSVAMAGAERTRPAQLAASVRTTSRPTGFFPGWFVNRTTGWIAMSRGGVTALYKTADRGYTWTQQLPLPYPKLFQRDMSFVDENVGFVVVGVIDKGKMVSALYATVDGGQHWALRSLPERGSITGGVDFVSASRGWVLIEHSSSPATLYSTTDGGHTWTSIGTAGRLAGVDARDHLEGIRFDNAKQGWIAGWRPPRGNTASTALYYWTGDGGTSWTPDALPAARSATSGQPSSPLDAAPPMLVDPPQRQRDGTYVGGTTIVSSAGPEIQVFGNGDAAPGHWQLVLRGVSGPGGGAPAWSVADGEVIASTGQSAAVTSSAVTNRDALNAWPTGLSQLQLVTAADGYAVGQGASGGPRTLYVTADGGRSWAVRASLDIR